MGQRFYQFWTSDQPDFNWLTRVTSRDGEYGMRFRYLKLLCRECSRFGLEDVFRDGFDSHIRIKVSKGRNILTTDDHFLCVSDAILHALINAGVQGFEYKQLPETPWHVLSITNRRPFDQRVYKTEGRRCSTCGRQAQYRAIQNEREIEPPSELLTFFCTATERGQGGFDSFVTEALFRLLKDAGLKGAAFHRLFTAEEEDEIAKRRQTQPTWRPKGSAIAL
jgi:hypothetical protein